MIDSICFEPFPKTFANVEIFCLGPANHDGNTHVGVSKQGWAVWTIENDAVIVERMKTF